MPICKVTIDGNQIEVENSSTIIEAAEKINNTIPHFCWHPKLSVSGNCRMCLVEVEKIPKLVIACMTKVSDGMIIYTNNSRVIKAREAVMEFILINHPLDCPICDEAGECKLQDYAYNHSAGYSRFVENKVHKPKRVEIGPRVMFDAERCISCSRCIRFCDEIVGKHQLQFVNRGDKVTIETFPGESLDNNYSMNVVDICPVGALTNRDFRFKSRVWEMSFTDSVCVGCSRGCNIEIGSRNNEILRLTPRKNEEVNSYWMCDNGRINSFKFVNDETRLATSKKENENLNWIDAIAQTLSELKKYNSNEIGFVASPFATNEDNYFLKKLISDKFPNSFVTFATYLNQTDEDNLLIKSDKTPNSNGVKEIYSPYKKNIAFDLFLEKINSKEIKCVYTLDEHILDKIKNIQSIISHATNDIQNAKIVLASSTFAEVSGTVTNFNRRVQRLRPALMTTEPEFIFDGINLSRWEKFKSWNDRWGKGPQRDSKQNWKILQLVANSLGAKYNFKTTEEVFNEMASIIPSFKNLTYLKIGKLGSQLN
ncbi:MAG: 2Fe-2S iron-sulfur cluster-binding protein [Bacteroidota bacterium]